MAWWSKFSRKAPAAPISVYSPVEADEDVIDMEDPRVEEGAEIVGAFWRGIGEVDSNVISQNSLAAALQWPAGYDGYLLIRTPDSLILASDGLAAPFIGTDETDRSGFGIEVFIEAPGMQSLAIADVIHTAVAPLIQMVGQSVAINGELDEALDRIGFITMPVLRGKMAERWLDDRGLVNVVMGVDVPGRSARLALPFGPVRVVSVTPLLPSEAAVAIRSRSDCVALNAALAERGWAGKFLPDRPAVI